VTAPDRPDPGHHTAGLDALLRRIVEWAAEPHLLVDPRGRVAWSNAAFVGMWPKGLPGDGTPPPLLADLLVPGSDPAALDCVLALAGGQLQPGVTEVELAFRTLRARCLRLIVEVDPAGGGALLYAGRVAAGANELQNQFEAAIDALDDGFALYDAEDRLVMANTRYREIFDYSADAIRPGVRFETILRAGLAKGMPPYAMGREEAWLAQRMDEHRRGTVWVERRVRGRWLRIYERRTPAGWHVALRMDITALKAREERLAELNRLATERLELLDTVLENIGVGVHLFDDELMLRYWNSTYLRMVGLPPDAVTTGTPFDAIIRTLHARGHYDGADYDTELARRRALLLRPDHSYRRERADGSVVEVHGQHLPSGGIVSTYRDVTAETRMQRDLEAARDAAEAASRAKSDFLATMSHEIRTPMNGVLGMAAALAETDLDAEQRRMLEVVVDSGRVLQALLSDLLDLAQAESGALSVTLKPFRVAEIVAPLVEMHRARATARGLDLGADLRAAPPEARLGDPLRLRQVLDNLMSNALKFTDRGGVTLTVEAVTLSPRAGAPQTAPAAGAPGLRIRVADTGPGISAEDQAKLFRPFSRLDQSRTRETGGSGLGLAICRRLVEAMGGEIELHSALGAGTCVEVRVPAPPAPPVSPAQPARGQDATAPGALRPGLRVLVAEDVATNRLVLGHLLRASAAEVTAVEDGVAAVAAVTEGTFDVVLMDVMMPRMDGVAATRAIRAAEAAAGRSRVPIVALTADARAEDVESYLAAGMDAHVAKPIEPAAMRATIARVLRAR